MARITLERLVRAIGRRAPEALDWLDGELARGALVTGASRTASTEWYLKPINHYAYAGDTALHVAAAAYDRTVAARLLELGADVAARNRHGQQPLHYAADGAPTSATWDPEAQAAIVELLVAGGADPDAKDNHGVAPLHRAVRTRCTGAVRALLAAGANPRLRNKAGSTPRALAMATTGRGGSGTPVAKLQQALILELLER